MASSTTYTINVKSKGVKKADNDIKKLKGSIGGLSKAVAGLAIGFGVYKLGGAIINIGKSSIETAGQFETLRTRLDVMYGSVQRGGQAFDNFNKIAATTPFQLKNVVEAGASLKAFGADAEEMAKPIADLAAFMGVDIVDAASAFGRAFAGGAGAADMLKERGVLPLIASFSGIEDLTKLTIPEFRDVMEKALTDPSLGIAGMTEKMSKTWEGTVSNFKDGIERIKAAIGTQLISKIQPLIEDINTEFGKMGEIGWENVGTSMVDNWREIFRVLTRVFVEGGILAGKTFLVGLSAGFQSGYVAIGDKLMEMMGFSPRGAKTGWIDEATDLLIRDFNKALNDVGADFKNLNQIILKDAEEIGEKSKEQSEKNTETFVQGQKKANDELEKSDDELTRKKLENLAKSASSASEGAKSVIKSESMKAIAGLISSILRGVPYPFNLLLAATAGGAASGLIDKGLAQIPSFATGGSFVTNGAEPIMVGDNPSGRELVSVTPLDASGQPTSTAGGVNITFTGNVMSEQFIEEQAIPQIKEAIRRGADIGIG
tara:strand:- start:4012 stop:5643 length:1632 start_codon:yes stop_codon:yes gene_type:complete